MVVPGGGISLDGARWVSCRSGFLVAVRVLSRLFRRLFLEGLADAHPAGRLVLLRRARQPGQPCGLRRAPRAAEEDELVRLRQAALRRARGGARLSRPLHPPRRHLKQPPPHTPTSAASPSATRTTAATAGPGLRTMKALTGYFLVGSPSRGRRKAPGKKSRASPSTRTIALGHLSRIGLAPGAGTPSHKPDMRGQAALPRVIGRPG